MAYYVAGVTKCGVYFERRFLTAKRARTFADSVLLRVRGYRIERRDSFRPKLIIAATTLAMAASLLFPALAVADDSSSAAATLTTAEVQVDDSASAGSESDSRHDYSDVVNAQVVGDFYFIMLADTVLLSLSLGALAFLAFKPAR